MIPKISIVVPVYNREKVLKNTLDSIRAQTFKDFECIIIDNKSTDNSSKIAQNFEDKDKRFKLYRQNINVGPVNNWLKGVQLSKSTWVKILFSDDYIVTDCIEKCMQAIEKYPEIGFVYFNSDISFKETKSKLSKLYPSYSFLWKSLASHKNVPVSPTSAVFRKNDIIYSLSKEIRDYFNFDYYKTGAGPDQAIYLYTADSYQYIYFIDEFLAIYGNNSDSITVKFNKTLPGFLLIGVLLAQYTFLKNSLIKKKIKGKFFYITISYHIIKWFIRYKILNKLKNYVKIICLCTNI